MTETLTDLRAEVVDLNERLIASKEESGFQRRRAEAVEEWISAICEVGGYAGDKPLTVEDIREAARITREINDPNGTTVKIVEELRSLRQRAEAAEAALADRGHVEGSLVYWRQRAEAAEAERDRLWEAGDTVAKLLRQVMESASRPGVPMPTYGECEDALIAWGE